ncbi:MAG: hypothetical protein AMXMBFR64_12690 [Myxococcales bacterium]
MALLVANLLHGFVALSWAVGVRRFAGPLSPTLWADVLRLCLGLPPLVATLRVLGLPPPPDALTTLRVDLWTEALAANPVAPWLLGALLAGTAALFLVQEAAPAWRHRRGRMRHDAVQDPELSQVTEDVLSRLRQSGLVPSRGRPPHARRLETDDAVAGLTGITAPVVVASRGLLGTLDDKEREATVAHELAHWVRGGNLGILFVWALRALQAPNPGALVLFRALVEAEEGACDEVAARVTGRPAALASALIKAHAHPDTDGPGLLARARAEVLRHAELQSTRARVRQLLDAPLHHHPAVGLRVTTVVVLFALLWSIG